MPTINIEVKNKIARQTNKEAYVDDAILGGAW